MIDDGHNTTENMTAQSRAEEYRTAIESQRASTSGTDENNNDNNNNIGNERVQIQLNGREPNERSKRLRFGTIRHKKKGKGSAGGGTKRNPSIMLRQVSQHIPGLASLVPRPGDDGDNQAASREVERTCYINQPLPQSEVDPETGYPKVQYCRNKVRTTKYTPLTFVPLNLWHQFHNIANIYFLFIVILSAFPIFGVESPGLAAVPIIVIVIITAFKDAIEDYRRMVLDSELNNTVTRILTNYDNANVVEDNVSNWRKFKKWNTRVWGGMAMGVVRFGERLFFKTKKEDQKQPGDDKELQRSMSISSAAQSHYTEEIPFPEKKETYRKDGSIVDSTVEPKGVAKFVPNFWKHVEFGSIVKVKGDEEFPADMVVLSTSDPDGACFVETRNLDGETNLKVRQGLRASQHIKHARDLEQCVFQIDSEGPHKGLYTYNGVMKWQQRVDMENPGSEYEHRSEPISINNLLLRGCTLRNTDWVIGVAIYTGNDSRVMMNTGETPAKRSRIMRELNFNVICNFVLVLVLAFVAAVINGVYFNKSNTSAAFFEFGMIGDTPPVAAIVTFWAAVILLQNLIPISLYISIEIIKTLHAFFIWNDTFMYWEPVDYRCTPKSWSISDDLGQVEYIFSDKTGTLTQNVMEFRKCTVAGKEYGKAFTEAMVGMLKRKGHDGEKVSREAFAEIAEDKQLMLTRLGDIYENPELFPDAVNFVSSELITDMEPVGSPGRQFLLALALCHSVLPERDAEGKLVFKAQSPDEEALVATARDCGFTLKERTRNGVEVDALGQVDEYEILCTLEFNSSRKRMSVIVRMPDTGKIKLLCKGADSMIYSRLTPDVDSEVKQATATNLENFANEGLRTLCVAEKELSEDEYQDWAKRHDEASSALQNREEKMEAVADEIEQDLKLLGGTAIEDRLQEGVPDAIALLGKAGIKIWVLTGDKVETAINIGYSCNLLDNQMELIVLQLEAGAGKDEADQLLTRYLDQYFGMTGSDEELEFAKKDHSPPNAGYAVVVDGDALEIVMSNEDLKQKFLLLCKQCKSVMCCRVSPSQKAQVVTLVKKTLDVMTLSIGDGANDVAMITEADVGCGIAGMEGRQAVMSSDYAFGQFKFLTRLLLVHGRWAYRRVAELTANLFYKNVVFTLTLFWFDVHNSFDGSYLFDYTYITLFNLAFTSLPVIFMGFLDQDVSDKVSMVTPQLYQRGILRQEWTNTKFWIYMVDGVYQSAVCYFMSFCVFYNGTFVNTNGRQINYREAYGVFTATSAIVACNLYVMINEYMWDWLFMLIVVISILLVFFWTGIYTQFVAAAGFYMAAPQVYGSLNFWCNTLLAITMCLLPRFAAKAYQKMYMPYNVDVVREQIRLGEYEYLKDVEIDKLDEKAVQQDGLSTWRDDAQRISTERMRMSMDINELTNATSLMQRTSTSADDRQRPYNV